VARALAEDLGAGDVTSRAAVPESARSAALLIAREAGVVAGLAVAGLAFSQIDPATSFATNIEDGTRVDAGTVVARVEGASRALLSAERVALNFVQRLSGIATLTRHFVDAIAGTGTRVLDTRKTTPGLRDLEKWAVAAGGGVNHRDGLWDMYLVKDNHIRAAGSLTQAVESIALQRDPALLLEVEAATLDLVREAAVLDVDRILLDNMSTGTLAAAVALVDAAGARTRTSSRRPGSARRWPELEASGGVTLATVRGIAETGVDYVSVGALTHSAKALDLALDFEA
jgi:nicotinate-nucleotide pyrophosphorylase (carboxylating)